MVKKDENYVIEANYLVSENLDLVGFNRVGCKRENGGVIISYNNGKIHDTLPGETETIYPLDESPDNNSLTVKRAVLDILGTIDLQKLCTSVQTTAVLVDIAYNAVVGISGAHVKLYELRGEMLNVIEDSVKLSLDFKNASSDVNKKLTRCYEYLIDPYEDVDSVQRILLKCSNTALKMSEDSAKMADKFDLLKEKTLSHGKEIVTVENIKIEDKKNAEKSLLDFKASLDGYEASKKELETRLKEANELYSKYDKQAEELNKKANTAEVIGLVVTGVGVIAQGVGTAMGGYGASKSPAVNINSNGEYVEQNNELNTLNTGKKADLKDSTVENPKQDTNLPVEPEDVKSRRDRLGNDKAELLLIDSRIKNYPNLKAALEHEKAVKSGSVVDDKITPRDLDVIDAELKRINDEEKRDSSRKLELETEISSDNSYITSRLGQAASQDIVKAAGQLETKFEGMATTSREAAAAKDKLAQEMLKLKFELQEKQTQNLAKIAEYTQKIKNTNFDVNDLSVAINSLQLAITCLSSTVSILSEVSIFWSSLKTACEQLASNDTFDDLLDRINDIVSDHSLKDREKLAKYCFESSNFGRDWFILLCQWWAVYLVTNSYYIDSTNAHKIIGESLSRIEQDSKSHWDLARKMAEATEKVIDKQLLSDKIKNKDYQARIAKFENEKEKTLEDIRSFGAEKKE
jgi:hypothetical protein